MIFHMIVFYNVCMHFSLRW